MRKYIFIFALSILFVFQGCAFFKNLGGSSEEEAGSSKMSKEEMINEIEKTKIENENLRKQIELLTNENERIRSEKDIEIDRIRNQNEFLIEELKRLKEENQKYTRENEELKKRLSACHHEEDMKNLKIKVLSGDGDLDSAGQMAVKLRHLGYDIKSIDRATRSDYAQNIVYFTPTCSKEGKRLASAIGGNTIAKPLGWNSVFDLIVVTGKSP